jgi:hypothetical protein
MECEAAIPAHRPRMGGGHLRRQQRGFPALRSGAAAASRQAGFLARLIGGVLDCEGMPGLRRRAQDGHANGSRAAFACPLKTTRVPPADPVAESRSGRSGLVHAITSVPLGSFQQPFAAAPTAFFAALESTLHWALANANQRKHSLPTCALPKVGRLASWGTSAVPLMLSAWPFVTRMRHPASVCIHARPIASPHKIDPHPARATITPFAHSC